MSYTEQQKNTKRKKNMPEQATGSFALQYFICSISLNLNKLYKNSFGVKKEKK